LPHGLDEPARSAPRLRVLVVDDEPSLLAAIVREIGQYHDVIGRESFPEALEELKGRHYDLVLCDVMMPGVAGVDIYRALCEIMPQPTDRVVFMTGGAFTHEARQFLAQIPNRCLEKPFSPAELQAILRSLGPRAQDERDKL
jgi:CheY-like chemotaxis protein